MMKIKLLPFFLLLLGQLFSCTFGPDSPLDERFYGTWLDPHAESESVIFREDGTLNWFGEEGTFGTYKYHTGCGESNGFQCIKGHAIGLEVSLPSVTFKLQTRFGTDPNSWDIGPLSGTGCRNCDIYKKRALLFREGSFERPIMPGHFEKNTGILGPNRYQAPVNVVSTTPLRASQRQDGEYYYSYATQSVYDYHESTDTWEVAPGFGANHYQIGKEVMVENSSNNFRASVDKGATWKTLPDLDTEGYRVGGDKYNLAATTFVKAVNVTPPCPWGEYPCRETDVYEIWTMNAAADSPSWTRRRSFTTNYLRHLYTHPTNGVIFWYYDQNHAEISTDFGLTWKPFSPECTFSEATTTVPHLNGFLCTNESDEVLWYNSNTDTWTTHHVNFDDFATSGDLTDGAYIRRGDQIIKWQPDGSETNITTVSGSLGYGNIQVFDDQVFVDKFGLWRTER